MGSTLTSLLTAMASDAYGLLMETARDRAKAKRGESAASAAEAMPAIPEIPPLPKLELPPLPQPLGALTPPAKAPEPAKQAPASVADSYAAEMPDDPGVACKPCTMRHLTTITEAARTAAASADPEVWRQQVALIAAEALVWEQYDLTSGKLARADAGTRQAVLSARPAVHALLQSVSTAPDRLSLAWGALLESRRFAEGKAPTERDWQQVQERVADTLGWIGYLESTERATLGAHVNSIRPARQRLTSEGPTPEVLAVAESAVGAAAVALTPPPSREQVDALHRQAKAARDAFFRAAMGRPPKTYSEQQYPYSLAVRVTCGDGKSFDDAVKGLNAGHALHRARDNWPTCQVEPLGPELEDRSRFNPADWILDRETAIPNRYRDMMPAKAYSVQVPQDGLLGATPATAAAWTNLLQFAGAFGITVRDRQLPAEWEGGIVKGAYNPHTRALVIGPAATAEDSDGDQTLIHELAHALLHNPKCLPNPTPPDEYTATYGESVEEVEADAATFLTMSHLRLPIEHDDATRQPAPDLRVALASLRSELDTQTFERAAWASDVLSAAATEGAGAVGMAAACPVRQ